MANHWTAREDLDRRGLEEGVEPFWLVEDEHGDTVAGALLKPQALLIAAAPELLAALAELIGHSPVIVDDDGRCARMFCKPEWVDQAKAAIAKVRAD